MVSAASVASRGDPARLESRRKRRPGIKRGATMNGITITMISVSRRLVATNSTSEPSREMIDRNVIEIP